MNRREILENCLYDVIRQTRNTTWYEEKYLTNKDILKLAQVWSLELEEKLSSLDKW